MRSCSKPGCADPAAAVLVYSYSERLAILEDGAVGTVPPHAYALCAGCAGRLSPPRGWRLDDRRSEPALFLPAGGDLLGERAANKPREGLRSAHLG